MSKQQVFQRIEKAVEKIAKISQPEKIILFGSMVEKLLKSLLVFHQKEFSKTHDLTLQG